MKWRSKLVVALVLGESVLACVTTPGDGGRITDSRADAAGLIDAATPPLGDGGPSDTGGPARASEGGPEAGATADAADAAVDPSDGSVASSPLLFTAGVDGILDFDVDATNLYLLFASTKIAKCPIAGCGPGVPSTLRGWTNATEIEALNGFVHYIFHVTPRPGFDYTFFGAVKADGTVVGDRITSVSPSSAAIANLRTDGSYVYATTTLNRGAVPEYREGAGLIPGGLGDREHRFGATSSVAAPPFDVAGDLIAVALPGRVSPSTLPVVQSWLRGATSSTRFDYPAVLSLPTAIAIDMDVVVILDGARTVHFCDRTSCAGWTSTGTAANAIALDPTHLYFGTDTGVLRCEVAEMKTLGTCTPALVRSTAASVVQVVAKSGGAYARTTTSSIVRVVP